MFNFGQLAALLANPGKMRDEMQAMHERIGRLAAEGEAGGGLVSATVNGRMEVIAVRIVETAVSDRELLEDLVAAAVNQALAKVREQVQAEAGQVAGKLGLPLPPGLGLPGMP
jgi:DNA-binding YbaB/EbfC family protein